MLDRIKRATPATISNTWYSAGTIADPGTVTVGIVRADGSVVVPAGTATAGSGPAARTFPLTAAHTALLDTLTATWTSSTLGTDTTEHEVVGDFLFSLADARAMKPLDDPTKYPTATLTAMRTAVEQALEDACGVAFVPRYELETFTVDGCAGGLVARWPRITAVRSAMIDGTDITPLSDVLGVREGLIYLHRSWGYGWHHGWGHQHRSIVVGYEHGHTAPPARVSRAGLLLARSWLVSGPVDDRAATFSAGADGGTYSLVVPGRNGSVFGLPEVDAVVQQYDMRAGVA